MKKKILSIVIIIIMLAGLMFTLTGCKSKFTVDEIIQYMSEKYGENFTYIEPVGIDQPTASSLSIYVKSEKYPDKKIYARCLSTNDDNGKKRFMDNYYAIIYEKDMRKLLTMLTESVYGNVKIRYIPEDDGLTEVMYSDVIINNFDEFKEKAMFSYTIMLPYDYNETNKKEDAQKLFQLVKKECTNVSSIAIIGAKDSEQFDSFSTEQYSFINGRFHEYISNTYYE